MDLQENPPVMYRNFDEVLAVGDRPTESVKEENIDDILKKDNVFSPYSWATYYAVKRTIPIMIDGDLSEWSDVRGVTMDQEIFFFAGC